MSQSTFLIYSSNTFRSYMKTFLLNWCLFRMADMDLFSFFFIWIYSFPSMMLKRMSLCQCMFFTFSQKLDDYDYVSLLLRPLFYLIDPRISCVNGMLFMLQYQHITWAVGAWRNHGGNLRNIRIKWRNESTSSGVQQRQLCGGTYKLCVPVEQSLRLI